jgi:hypothetical protein
MTDLLKLLGGLLLGLFRSRAAREAELAFKKKAIHRRSRFFGTHELPGADCPIQKAAPRKPSGYVTTIGTEPQVVPFRARSRDRSSFDSLLEGSGFETSVPEVGRSFDETRTVSGR